MRQYSHALKILSKSFPGVNSVKDAEASIFINVIKADTTRRGKKNHRECAVAVALKRQFGLDGVIVSRSMAYLIKGSNASRFQLPTSVIKEIVAFDRGGGFAPGKYMLKPASPSSRLGAERVRPALNRTVRTVGFRHMATGVRAVIGGQVTGAN